MSTVLPWFWLVLLLAANRADAQGKKPEPLKLRVGSSIVVGVNEKSARGATQPLVDIVSEHVQYPFDFDLLTQSNKGAENLRAFGKQVDDGVFHLVAVWGLEYGWLLKDYPKLEVLVLVTSGDQNSWRSQLMVRSQSVAQGLAQLKGKRLARFKAMPMMDELILDDMLLTAGQNPEGFFVTDKKVPTVKDALLAVKNGKADCVLVNVTEFNRAVSSQPGFGKALRPLELSDRYPGPAIIGRRDHIQHLKNGLWGQLQNELLRILDTPEGEEVMRVWQLEGFAKPDRQYLDQVKNWAEKIPIELTKKPRASQD